MTLIHAWMIRPRALSLIGTVQEVLDWEKLADDGVFTENRVRLEIGYDAKADIWCRCSVPMTERYGGSSVDVTWSPREARPWFRRLSRLRRELVGFWRMVRR